MDWQQRLAKHLAQLRREQRQVSGLDQNLVPADAASAYQVAHLVEQELDWEVVGWKIAATNLQMQQALRTDSPIYGRVFAPHIHPSPHAVEHRLCCSPIPEVEYQVRLSDDLAPRAKPYSADEVTDAVASIHPGIELAECRFIHDKQFPPLPAILADGAGSGTLVYGEAISDWRDKDIANQIVSLWCGGKERRSGTAKAALVHPIVPLTWLANELSRTGIGLKAGQMISTGTLTGMLRPQPGEHYRADFGPFGEVRASYT